MECAVATFRRAVTVKQSGWSRRCSIRSKLASLSAVPYSTAGCVDRSAYKKPTWFWKVPLSLPPNMPRDAVILASPLVRTIHESPTAVAELPVRAPARSKCFMYCGVPLRAFRSTPRNPHRHFRALATAKHGSAGLGIMLLSRRSRQAGIGFRAFRPRKKHGGCA